VPALASHRLMVCWLGYLFSRAAKSAVDHRRRRDRGPRWLQPGPSRQRGRLGL